MITEAGRTVPRRRTLPRSAATIIMSGSLLVAAIGVSDAATASPKGVINGCVKNSTHVLSILDTSKHKKCAAGSSAIRWNQSGPAGAVGVAGPKGQPGVTGATGATGATGGVGDAGTPGAPGATGATGSAGDVGAPGATGATGLTGNTGNTGQQGPQGVQGVAGPKGNTGNTGAAGPAGPNGAIVGYLGGLPGTSNGVEPTESFTLVAETPAVPVGTYMVNASAAVLIDDGQAVDCRIEFGSGHLGYDSGDDAGTGGAESSTVASVDAVTTISASDRIGYYCESNHTQTSDITVGDAAISAIPVTGFGASIS